MGDYDFSYKIPENFLKRTVQYLQQLNKIVAAESLKRCTFEYEDVGLAFYAGLKGDNWNKKALDFTFEGSKKDIDLLRSANTFSEQAISKALKPSESGFLLRDIFYFETEDSLDDVVMYSSNEERLNADIQTSKAVLSDLIQIGECLSLNHLYNSSCSENTLNDYFRDMLTAKGYAEVKDQTRHGISSSGKDAGEVDLLLTKEGKEIAIFEGLKLNCVNASYIDQHIDKAIINYNAFGTATFIVGYINSSNFESFWDNFCEHIRNYTFPLQIKRELQILTHPNASTRIAIMILSRDGYDFPVYFMAININ